VAVVQPSGTFAIVDPSEPCTAAVNDPEPAGGRADDPGDEQRPAGADELLALEIE